MKNESNVIYQALGLTLWTLLAMFLGAVLVRSKPAPAPETIVIEADYTEAYADDPDYPIAFAPSIAEWEVCKKQGYITMFQLAHLYDEQLNNDDLPEEMAKVGDRMLFYLEDGRLKVEYFRGQMKPYSWPMFIN